MADGQAADSRAPGNPLSKLPVEIMVAVGRARPTIRDLLALREDSVLELDRTVDDPVEIFVGDRLIARGILEEHEGGEPGQLAVRLTEVVDLAEGL